MTYGCYVHIPFCIKKCRYCDFVSFPVSADKMREYIDALLIEAKARVVEVNDSISTVYIGGGTPSLVPPALAKRLFKGLYSILDFNKVSEWSVEANPGTVTYEWLNTVLKCGCNRISLGIQAFQPKYLKMLGRSHNPDDITQSVLKAREAGFSNINLDLMFGLPSQNMKDWVETLYSAILLEPEHISAYGLIPEQGTQIKNELDRGILSLPDPEEEREMYSEAIRILSANGYEQYEISNFARKGYQCIHNLGYWQQKPYIGLGVAAVSMLFPINKQNEFVYERKTNPFCLSAYLRGIQKISNKTVSVTEIIGPEDSRFESLMLGLRLTKGVSEDEFFEKHNISLSDWRGDKLKYLAEKGLLIHTNGYWKLTRRGMDIQNSVLVELM